MVAGTTDHLPTLQGQDCLLLHHILLLRTVSVLREQRRDKLSMYRMRAVFDALLPTLLCQEQAEEGHLGR